MNILIVGVSGFVGRHLFKQLSRAQHNITGCSRKRVANIHWQPFDYAKPPGNWDDLLTDIDIVINASGIFQQTDKHQFNVVHNTGPKKLFDACAYRDIKVLQISAIGAEEGEPVTEFLRSKREADQYLLHKMTSNIVLYPGLILGEKGRSTHHLSALASMVLIPLIFRRNKELPLLSVYQLSDYIIKLIESWPDKPLARVVIARPETMVNLLSNLRRWMGMSQPVIFEIPSEVTKMIFYLFPSLTIGVLSKHSIIMSNHYSSIKHIPVFEQKASNSLMVHTPTMSFKNDLQMRKLYYFNLFTLSIIWILSGLSSIINMELSRELISPMGFETVTGEQLIYIAALGDIILGVFLWIPTFRNRVIYVQMIIMFCYSIVITLTIPAYWLHPFAPVVKNLAMFVLALYLLLDNKKTQD